MACYIHVVGLL